MHRSVARSTFALCALCVSLAAVALDSAYMAAIHKAIRSKVVFELPKNYRGNQFAEFSMRYLPDGTLAGRPLLVHPSGLPEFDEALRAAIVQVNPLPRSPDGEFPKELRIEFRPEPW